MSTRQNMAVFSVACCLLLTAGCGAKDPFSYAQVSGKVSYEDGTLIPADYILLFYPQSGPLDAKTYPRCGTAIVEKATGRFNSITSYKPGDGLVRGKHKVTLLTPGHDFLPASLVPPEYGSPLKTPLEVDTAQQPFELRIKKP